jgi:hypothetical protein
MVITVDFTGGTVTLVDPADFTRFHVETRGDGDLSEALAAASAGRVEGEHAFIDVDWLRVNGDESDEWGAGFTKMLGYAQSKGWLDDRGAIQAHVERHTD